MQTDYEVGDTCVVKDGGKDYQAKVLKIEMKKGKNGKKIKQYFIHYLGWNSRWDKWVELKEITPIELKNPSKKKKARKSENLGAPASTNNSVKKVKTEESAASSVKSESVCGGEESSASGDDAKAKTNKPSVRPSLDGSKLKIRMGLALKEQLASEWQRLSQAETENTLVPLPRSPTVNDILQQFVESRKLDITPSAFEDFAEGLREFFDEALPLRLLYKSERKQYDDMFGDPSGKKPSEVYGAEHFLRLFVVLGDCLNTSDVTDKKEKKDLQEKITGLLQFLLKHQDSFFLDMDP
ncbi:unnamed protein product [Heterosigma akashiwo]